MATRKKKVTTGTTRKTKKRVRAQQPSARPRSNPVEQTAQVVVVRAVNEDIELHPNAVATAPVDVREGRVILDLAPTIFCRARISASVAVVLFTYIRSNKLYVQDGFETMRPYAAERLGVGSEDDYKKTARAGNSAWSYMPEKCVKVVQDILTAGEVTAVTPLPTKTALALLPRVVRKTDVAGREDLVRRVVEGECSSAELERMDQAARSAGRHRRRGGAARGRAPTPSADPQAGNSATFVGTLKPYFPSTSDQVMEWATQHATKGQQGAALAVAVLAAYERLKLVSWVADRIPTAKAVAESTRDLLDALDSVGTGKRAAQLLGQAAALEADLLEALGTE